MVFIDVVPISELESYIVLKNVLINFIVNKINRELQSLMRIFQRSIIWKKKR